MANVYIKTRFLASLAPQAARHDLNVLQSLLSYTYPQIKASVLRKMAGQLRFLSKDLILSLFDPDMELATKQIVLKVSEDIEGDEKQLPLATVDMTYGYDLW